MPSQDAKGAKETHQIFEMNNINMNLLKTQ